MVRFLTKVLLTALLAVSFLFSATARILEPAADSINNRLSSRASTLSRISIDTFYVLKKQKAVKIILSDDIIDYPLRNSDLEYFSGIIGRYMPEDLREYGIQLYVKDRPLSTFISGFYSGQKYVSENRSGQDGRRTPWISRISGPAPEEGLYGRNIALWPGHGYYYSNTEDRWKWQRAPFFSTIEDLLPQSYIISFLAPMLENAGATVLMPRERDIQRNEIIVDNISPYYTERNGDRRNEWKDAPGPGFAHTEDVYASGVNPFEQGTARMVGCSLKSPSSATYIPYFPETGDYAVYVSYQTVRQSTDALYTVRYSGGEASFSVDQRMGGGMWVYLGTFRFSKGETGQGVIVRNCAEKSGGNGVITTDAVKFGGGMGNILRGTGTSGVPRYAEAARYWMQWSGFPEEVYSLNNGNDDYRDDYMSRGEWVNDLCHRLAIPVDMALALHTDAGSVLSDSTIGTLAIYKEESEGKIHYSDGRPRIIARELADIIQTSVVEDIRSFYRTDWTRRALWDRSYMEARVPDVPAVLIELLSHQNFPDMQCALDPKFKFIVSRAIYKGILKYLSYIHDEPYCVQPLPVQDLSVRIDGRRKDEAEVRLSWTPREDPGEPTAMPSSYIVYRRIADTAAAAAGNIPGFDEGTPVTGTEYTDNIQPGRIYSYRVVAVNNGGQSFPSETLSAGYIPESEEVLVVNGFSSVSAPAPFPVCDSVTAGFDFRADHGIPYIQDCSYIGEQFEYLRQREWIHDDRPGFGASYMDYGPAPVAGNSMDYPRIHGLALMRAGLSFSSVSLGGFLNRDYGLEDYPVVDIILGKENSDVLNGTMYSRLADYCREGGNLLLSGANIGKISAYDSGRSYSGSLMLKEALSSVKTAASRMEALKDSLSGSADTALLSKIEAAARELMEFAGKTAMDLDEDIISMHRESDPDFIANRLASDIFNYGWSNGSASTSGLVRTVSNPSGLFADSTYTVDFQTRPNPLTYCVESPDAILPSDEQSFTFMRYCGSNTSAAVAYDGDYRAVSLGFPIEALTSQQQVDDLMREVIRFLLGY